MPRAFIAASTRPGPATERDDDQSSPCGRRRRGGSLEVPPRKAQTPPPIHGRGVREKTMGTAFRSGASPAGTGGSDSAVSVLARPGKEVLLLAGPTPATARPFPSRWSGRRRRRASGRESDPSFEVPVLLAEALLGNGSDRLVGDLRSPEGAVRTSCGAGRAAQGARGLSCSPSIARS